MNQKEWLEYFETINDRKPTPAEMAQAQANGDFVSEEGPVASVPQTDVETVPNATVKSQVSVNPDPAGEQHPSTKMPKKTLSKKAKIIISSLVGLVALLLLSVGGYTAWRYQAGKIPAGTYQLSSYRYYDDDEEKMVDGMEYYKENKIELEDFVKVKGNDVKTVDYMTSGSFQFVSSLDYETDNEFKANVWSHTLVPSWTLSEYTDIVDKVLDKQYENAAYRSESDIKASKEEYVNDYKKSLKLTYGYKVEGDKLIVTTYNKKGRVEVVRTYKRLSEEDTKKLDFEYDRAVKKNKELYNSK